MRIRKRVCRNLHLLIPSIHAQLSSPIFWPLQKEASHLLILDASLGSRIFYALRQLYPPVSATILLRSFTTCRTCTLERRTPSHRSVELINLGNRRQLASSGRTSFLCSFSTLKCIHSRSFGATDVETAYLSPGFALAFPMTVQRTDVTKYADLAA